MVTNTPGDRRSRGGVGMRGGNTISLGLVYVLSIVIVSAFVFSNFPSKAVVGCVPRATATEAVAYTRLGPRVCTGTP